MPGLPNLRDSTNSEADVRAALRLQPHPEGGHYRELWNPAGVDGSRGGCEFHPVPAGDGRAIALAPGRCDRDLDLAGGRASKARGRGYRRPLDPAPGPGPQSGRGLAGAGSRPCLARGLQPRGLDFGQLRRSARVPLWRLRTGAPGLAAAWDKRGRGVERAEGIEPSSVAWKATALPLCYARTEPDRIDHARPSDRLKVSLALSRGDLQVLGHAPHVERPALDFASRSASLRPLRRVQAAVLPAHAGMAGRRRRRRCRGVAQLARAPVSKTGGCGFETLRPCHLPACPGPGVEGAELQRRDRRRVPPALDGAG